MGIIVLYDLCHLVVKQVDYGKGGISNSAHGAHGQSRRDGGNALLDGKPCRHHGGYDLGGKGGQNTSLYTAAKTVREHYDGRAVALLYHVHVVAAKLLAHVIDALISYIRT